MLCALVASLWWVLIEALENFGGFNNEERVGADFLRGCSRAGCFGLPPSRRGGHSVLGLRFKVGLVEITSRGGLVKGLH